MSFEGRFTYLWAPGLVYTRIRKIKCDENKPSCRKCTSTGRTCDGYESPFKVYSNDNIGKARNRNGTSRHSLQTILPARDTITAQNISLLNRCFSVKTVFDIELGCNMEAKQVLEASLTDQSIQHAVLALKALRQDFERTQEMAALVPGTSSSYDHGLEQYCSALKALTSSQSPPSSQGLRSTLLCCQVFICIEQVQQNYATMAQHVTQGLKIMHQFRARPYLNVDGELMPAHDAPLPHLDMFLIKMFSAPCKFSDISSQRNVDEGAAPTCPIWPHQQPDGYRSHRSIVPDLRAGLTRIASLVLEFLDKVSQAKAAVEALQLLFEKRALQRSLESWLDDLDATQPKGTSPDMELISVSFMRLFHRKLQIIVLSALEDSPDVGNKLKGENDRLQHIASVLGDRLRTYRMGDAQK